MRSLALIISFLFVFDVNCQSQWIYQSCNQGNPGFFNVYNSIELGTSSGYLTFGQDSLQAAYNFDINGNLLSRVDLESYFSEAVYFNNKVQRFGNRFLYTAINLGGISDSLHILITDSIGFYPIISSVKLPYQGSDFRANVLKNNNVAVSMKMNSKLFFFELDTLGNYVWKDSINSVMADIIGITATVDSGIVYLYNDTKLKVRKYDKYGNLIFTKAISNYLSQYDFLVNNRIVNYMNDGFLVAFPRSSTNSYYEIIRLNAIGDTLWSISDTAQIIKSVNDLIAYSNGDFSLLGYNDNFLQGNHKTVILKVDSSFNVLLNEQFNFPNIAPYIGTGGRSFINTSDGGYLITGHNGNFVEGQGSILIKTNEFGQCNPLVVESNDMYINDVKVYPNPSLGIVTIEGASKYTELEVANVLGENVLSIKNNLQKFDVHIFVAGIYFFKFSDGNQIKIKKIVVN